jgi:phosphocarrier protein HPr
LPGIRRPADAAQKWKGVPIMYIKKTIIVNTTGLHARPATEFVKLAKSFQSKIMIRNASDSEGIARNAKSVVFVLSLGLSKGKELEISAEGEDEVTAVDALAELVESGFGE